MSQARARPARPSKMPEAPEGSAEHALYQERSVARASSLGGMSGASRGSWIRPCGLFAALVLFFGWYATVQLRRYPVGAQQAAAIYLCFLLLIVLYLAPGFAISRAWLVLKFRGIRGAAASAAIFLLPYLIYCTGTGDFRLTAFAKLAALAALPLGLFAVVPVKSPRRLNWQDALVLLWLFLPVVFHLISGIWNVPVNLDFMARLFLVGVGAWSFLIQRGIGTGPAGSVVRAGYIDDAGYDFTISTPILRDALVSFAGFIAIALPLGFALRFIAWNPKYRGLGDLLSNYLTILLFVAITEELFFRGLFQNLLETTLGSRHAAQAIASVLFGLSHIQHAPFPNWRYVTLATVAGWFYGSAYRRHRSLMASAGVHALVDTLWRTWFTLPG
jgi:membrane protease YdiL (CAAX protease family)